MLETQPKTTPPGAGTVAETGAVFARPPVTVTVQPEAAGVTAVMVKTPLALLAGETVTFAQLEAAVKGPAKLLCVAVRVTVCVSA